MNKPKVGILIPTFNRREMLREALASAQNQWAPEIEIIVIDNGSTDGTKEFMTRITDLRVRFVANERNLGPIGSIERGIRLFSPEVEWCTILPDDDTLAPDFVASMASFVKCHIAKSIVYGHRVIIDSIREKIRKTKPSPFEESAADYIHNRSRYRRETFLTGIFFSRMAFEAIGGYPKFTTGMASDDAFIFALAVKDRLYYNSDAIVNVRFHEGAISQEVQWIANHVRAVSEFGEYVMTVAVASGIGAEVLKHLKADLDRYMCKLNSDLWLRNFLFLVKEGPEKHVEELMELYLLTDHEFSFYKRISFDVYLARMFGWFPEKYCPYNLFWGMLQKISRIVYQ
jgi:glycosyltransferase involved in cell wall biosynthesis